MADRIQINDEQLDNIVGGAFNYYEDGTVCEIDDYGAYNCTQNAKRYISQYIVTQKPSSVQQVIDWAFANGYFTGVVS